MALLIVDNILPRQTSGAQRRSFSHRILLFLLAFCRFIANEELNYCIFVDVSLAHIVYIVVLEAMASKASGSGLRHSILQTIAQQKNQLKFLPRIRKIACIAAGLACQVGTN